MNAAKSLLNSFFKRILSWVYPAKCPICRIVTEIVPCELCRQSVVRQDIQIQSISPVLNEVRAFCVYRDEETAPLVRAYKYRRETALESYLAGCILDVYVDWDPEEDFIVPVPIHRSRLATRGFNQAEGLCSRLPEYKISRQLMRIRRTKPQVELSAEERAVNLAGAFLCDGDLTGKRILLVDDVFTTGATATECGKALKASGAAWVGVLCFAAKTG
jgi:ComF family protein